VVAIVLAAVGALLLITYVRSAADRAAAAEALVPVLVTTGPVPAGTPASELADLVDTVDVPPGARADDAVTDLAALDGLLAAADMVTGEQLLAARFLAPGQTAGVAPDRLRVTVRLEPERALGGEVRVGDTVGVLLSYDPFEEEDGTQSPNMTHLELHKVPVTRVQHDVSSAAMTEPAVAEGVESAPTGALLITLALDAPSVEQVVFAAEHGFVWLAAEPEAAPEAGTRIVTLGNAYGESQ
jgi:pilus assembly protein CpaB